MSPAVAVRERPILFSAAMVLAILEGRKTQTRRIIKPQPEVRPGGSISPHPQDSSLFLVQKWEVQPRSFSNFGRCENITCPYGKSGDRFWVKETFILDERNTKGKAPQEVIYDATPEWAMDHTGKLARVHYITGEIVSPEDARSSIDANKFWHKKPSIFMPRWASRITLEITAVRVERLNEISENDALAEGVEPWGLTETDIAHIQISDESPETKAFVRALGPGRLSAKAEYQMLWDEIHGKDAWSKNPFVWAISFKRIPQGGAQ